ncbi:MAG: hypothetical protein KatS3mg105_1023 [Gemmatales bacterium]|nr:MAG: hypothetical protein KatS3mg105_1023 [Gemmatales bacterium]
MAKKQPRLGPWNGRLRSERGEPGVLPRWLQGPVLLRIGIVATTVLAISSLCYWIGPPFPYRVGEIYHHDLRVRSHFKVVNQAETEKKRDEKVAQLPPTLQNDPEARAQARESVPPVIEEYPVGFTLVPRGEPITERQLYLLEQEHKAFEKELGAVEHHRRFLALCLVMSLLALFVAVYVASYEPSLADNLGRMSMVCLVVALSITATLVLSRAPWHADVLPITVTAMMFALAFDAQFALLFLLTLAVATAVALGNDVRMLLILMSGSAVAVLFLRRLRTRTQLVKVSAAAGIALMVMTFTVQMSRGQSWNLIAFDSLRNLVFGTLAGFLLAGSLPLAERCFGIITDVTLAELADGSHPLLKELLRRAPGTYTHSMMVATLSEAAAERIGANPLLARVGASFHDIGKMLKPHYFIENQQGENRHDALEPGLSTLIIIGHVKDGVALARQYNLPSVVVDFIEQHHGTTLIEYFYHEAVKQREEAGHGNGELESSFRYPGPKPRSREVGIVMLADAAESTSRALNDPNPNSLRKLVHELLMKRLLDGQFDESGLSLTELHLIEESITKSLTAMFHSRIRYPDQKAAEEAK